MWTHDVAEGRLASVSCMRALLTSPLTPSSGHPPPHPASLPRTPDHPHRPPGEKPFFSPDFTIIPATLHSAKA